MFVLLDLENILTHFVGACSLDTISPDSHGIIYLVAAEMGEHRV